MTASLGAPGAARSQDNSTWAQLLEEFADDRRVDYDSLARQPGLLGEYLEELESVDAEQFVRWSNEARMAFWINAYNAYTIRWILDHYPTAGILETVSLWRRALGAPFSNRFIPLGGAARLGPERLISLRDIEHEILRKRFNDPRIHFAIVCASKSCPKLRSTPYSAETLNRQLDENARDFMGDPVKNRYDAESRRLEVSKIFWWFRDDFAVGDGPEGYFARYGPPTASATAGKSAQAGPFAGHAGERAVVYLDYDWSLNGLAAQ